MAQLTWPAYTPRVALSLRHEQPARARAVPLVASRLRWIVAATLLLLLAPALGALSTGGASGPPSAAPAAIAQVASQARSMLSVTDFQLTLPLQEAKVLPPLPPLPAAASLPYGAAFWQAVPEPPVGTITQIIWAAAQEYHVSYSWLLGVAECESGLDPTNVNRSSGASGLFQFMPATFYGHGGTDIWNPVQQADIAAKMFSEGESGEWTCK